MARDHRSRHGTVYHIDGRQLRIIMTEDGDVVRVSAPGKLLLLGEHAVVYGFPVVAVALSDLRIQAKIVRVPVLSN